MKKYYLIIPILVITIIIILTITIFKTNKTKEDNTFKNIPFYKEELKQRYINYQNQYKLSSKETILRVNIGLDNDFYTNTKPSTKLNKTSILVNKYNYLQPNYIPDNLVKTEEYSKGGIYLVEEVYKYFKKMAKAAKEENLNIRIVSAYRSYDYQRTLYNRYLKTDTQKNVDTYSARPGYSEHQTGLAIDIDNIIINYEKFHLTQEFTWMKNNAYKYGFIIRYDTGKETITGYKYEPWHYRYVGTKISKYIHDNNLTYEEYYYEFLN